MRLHDIEDVLRQFPARARRTCYVNPRDPSEAVLTRGAWRSLTIGLAPIVSEVVTKLRTLGEL